MTYAQIYQAVQNIRFNATILSTPGGIKDWIRAREGEVWQYADWPLKESADPQVSVVNGAATIALPSTFTFPDQLLQLFDENGQMLSFLDPEQFFRRYEPSNVPTVSAGPGEAWTITAQNIAGVITPQLRIGPTPSTNRTYTVRGGHLPICRSAAGAWKLGTMSADTDLPWWPDDYHYFLVSGAIALGKRNQSDPSWQPDEQDFQQGMTRLASELLPFARPGAGGEIWGAAC